MKKKEFLFLFLLLLLIPFSVSAKELKVTCTYDYGSTSAAYNETLKKFAINVYDTTATIVWNDEGESGNTKYEPGDWIWNIKFTLSKFAVDTKVNDSYECPSLVAYTVAGGYGSFIDFNSISDDVDITILKPVQKNYGNVSSVEDVTVCDAITLKKSDYGFLTTDISVQFKTNSAGQRIMCINSKCSKSALGSTSNQDLDVSLSNSQGDFHLSSADYGVFFGSVGVNNQFTCPANVYVKADSTSLFYITSSNTDTETPVTDPSDVKKPDFGFDYEGELDCNDIKEIVSFIKSMFTFVQYGVILLVVVLSMLDYTKAVSSGAADAMKKANKKMVKRVIVVVVLLLAIPVTELVLKLFGSKISTCME